MKRLMYISQLKIDYEQVSSKELAKTIAGVRLEDRLDFQGITRFQGFRFNRIIFIYIEAVDEFVDFTWSTGQQLLFEAWPGAEEPRYCVPLLDIFHDSDNLDNPKWRANYQAEQHVAVIARLKPEMYASYIYYHYQQQEENPGSFNKSYLIGSYENYILAYYELPAPQGGDTLQGKLQTKQTPNNWQEIMLPHFIQWSDLESGHNLWRNMETLVSYQKSC